jgi:hypothetical protein
VNIKEVVHLKQPLLKEAAALAPDDPELVRHLRFAETYRERPPDLQYRIYVKYLPSR